MEIRRIPDEDRKGFTIAFDPGDVENIAPLTYFREHDIRRNMVLYREMLHLQNPVLTQVLSDDFFRKKALESWEERLAVINDAHVPPNFITLLESISKRDQERLLRDQSITTLGLTSFLCRAGTEFGYTMSKYRSEHLAKGVDTNKLPKLIHITDKGVKKVGHTPLTNGQLKNVILQRKVLIAHFLDRVDTWHCFFQTETSMRGEESWKGGQPHLHYLSEKWGVSRADVVQSIKDGKYPSTSVHIALTDYGAQPTNPPQT